MRTGSTMPRYAIRPVLRLLTLCLALAVAAPPTASASQAVGDTEAAPRTTMDIGGVSVVLIASEGKLFAFLDRLEDNAPVKNGQLTVTTADGKAIAFAPAASGLFVAPFDPGTRARDSFVVSVTSADGAGDATAEIVYKAANAELPVAEGGMRDKILIALAACGIGIVLGSMAVRRISQKRHELRPV
jgi:hypothetical protein